MEIRSHSFSKYAKFFEKLPFLTPWYAHVTKWMTLSNLECTRLWIWNVNAPFLCSTYCGTCTTSRWCYFPIVKPNFIVENDFNFLTYNLKIYHHVFTFQYCCKVLTSSLVFENAFPVYKSYTGSEWDPCMSLWIPWKHGLYGSMLLLKEPINSFLFKLTKKYCERKKFRNTCNLN